MSGPGDSLKHVFEDTMLDLNGSDMVIYKQWNTEQMTSSPSKGIKESETQFEFTVDTDIEKNDVIQIDNSRSFWQVIDVDEEIKFGTATNLNVRVRKVDGLGNEIKINSSGHAVFHGAIMGGVQIGGQGNTQTVTITNTTNPEFADALKGLAGLINNSDYSELDKEEYQDLIQRIDALSQKEQTDEVKELGRKKVLSLENALAAGKLVLEAAKYIPLLLGFFG